MCVGSLFDRFDRIETNGVAWYIRPSYKEKCDKDLRFIFVHITSNHIYLSFIYLLFTYCTIQITGCLV